MEPMRSLPGVLGATTVHERRGGSQRQAAAFRQALAGDAGAGHDGGPPAGTGRDAAAEAPVGSRLQPPAAGDRKDQGPGHHVDVLA